MAETSMTLEEIQKLLQSQYTYLQILGADNKLIKETVLSNATKLNKIDNKIDNITFLLQSFMESFNSYKNETREVEEKLILMTSKIAEMEEELSNKVSEKDYDRFADICRRNYNYWEEYEELTRKFLPVSEILYSNLQNPSLQGSGNIDFSPVVIELCRAIENEFLLKLFRLYVKDFVSRYKTSEEFEIFYGPDKWCNVKILIKEKDKEKEKSIREITKTLANVIRSTIKYEDYIPRFTLGDMNFILDKLTINEVIENSVLMKDLRDYISKHFHENELLTAEYMARIAKLVNDYRNPSAHPEFVSLEIAKECKEFLPDQIDFLIECKR